MKGLYSVGAGGDFTKLRDALAALKKCNIGANTTFELIKGDYFEVGGFDIPYVSGLSSTRRLTVRAKKLKGMYELVRLAGTIPSSTPRGIIRIPNKGRYITLEGLVFDGSVPMATLPGIFYGVVVFGSDGGQSAITLRNLTFRNFKVSSWKGGNSGMFYVYTTGSTANVTVERCTFENNVAASSGDKYIGLISTYKGAHNNWKVVRNKFVGNNVDAMNFFQGKWTGLLIANNMIVPSKERVALDLYGKTTALSPIRFQFNSVLLLSSGSSGVRGPLAGKGLDVRCNAVQSLAVSSTFVSGTYTVASGYNCLAGVTAGYKNATGDKLLKSIGFLKTSAPYDLHIGSSSLCQAKAKAFADIKDDFDGQARGALPDMGADER